MTETQVLAVQDLQTHFFTKAGIARAVDGISFTIGKGELGRARRRKSGSGKTVTGFSILGLVDPPGRIVGGSIKVTGAELVGQSEEQLRPIRGNQDRHDLSGPDDDPQSGAAHRHADDRDDHGA